MKLSVIIISFQSNHLLIKILKKLPKKYQIIIVENSTLQSTKKLEKKFKNTKVIIPEKNLGYATAFNLAFKKSKHKFVITLTPDVLINNSLISNIEKVIKNMKNFSLLAPEYKNKKIYQNYSPIKRFNQIKYKMKNFSIIEVKDIDWCFCILNKSKFKNKRILDENYFLYFETMDLCRKLYNEKKKMYVVSNLKFAHLGTSSSNKKFNIEIQINRNWHFSWSKFYFYKKNYNYLFALKKILPNLYQGIIGVIICSLILNFKDTKLHFSSLKGLLSAVFLMDSYFRPNLE